MALALVFCCGLAWLPAGSDTLGSSISGSPLKDTIIPFALVYHWGGNPVHTTDTDIHPASFS